jgi:homoserine kinase
MTFTRAEAYAPATVANLGVGFDIMGMALQEPGDKVEVEVKNAPGIEIVDIEGDTGQLPRDVSKNTAGVAAASTLRLLGENIGIWMKIKKGLPLASGLGSSAASAVAAAVAVNALFGSPLGLIELLPACLDGEALVSGYHADNIAPCLLGGITLVTGLRTDQIYQLPIPQSIHLALVTPDIAVPTSVARSVLPQSVSLGDMVWQTSAVARLVVAIFRGDVEAMAAAMEGDKVVEPARRHLIPYLEDMRRVAKEVGAYGLVVSGAGPTLCAICDRGDIAENVATAMKMAYYDAGIGSIARNTCISRTGSRLVRLS